MQELPKIAQARFRAQSGGGVPATPHPSADALNAFVERSLAADDRESVLAHLGECGECREVVSLSLPPQESVAPAVGSSKGWFRMTWGTMQWGAVAASVFVIASAVMLLRPGFNTKPELQIASNTAKVAQPAPSNKSIERSDNYISTDQERGRIVAGEAKNVAPAKAPSSTLAAKADDSFRRDKSADSISSVAGQRQQMYDRMVQSPGGAAQTPSSTMRSSPKDSGVDVGAAIAGIGPSKVGDEKQKAEADTSVLESRNEVAANRQPPAAAAPPATESPAQAKPGALSTKAAAEQVVVETEASGGKLGQFGNVRENKKEANTLARAPSAKKAKPAQEESTADLTLSKIDMQKSAVANHYLLVVSDWRVHDGRLQSQTGADADWLDFYNPPKVEGERLLSVANPIKGVKLFVGTTHGRLMLSMDHGKNWTRVAGGFTGDIKQIIFKNANEGSLHTTAGEEWTTSDGGTTWKKR